MANRWTVGPGRTFCFDGREIFTVARVTEPNIEIDPAALDDLTRAMCDRLNTSGAIVKQPYHARFCQRCGKRNLKPGQRCSECNHDIMGPAFKSALPRQPCGYCRRSRGHTADCPDRGNS